MPEDASHPDYVAVREVVRRICDRAAENEQTFALETENQTRSMREVLRRMEEVATIAEGAAAGAQQTSVATAEQIASLGELTATSQQLSEAAAKLTETIQRFRVNGGSGPLPAMEQRTIREVPQQKPR